jgi:hypothetical protein
MSDPRQQQLQITWSRDKLIGRIEIGGALWCAVEWSEKQQAWCIEDAEGRCLTHRAHQHSKAAAKDEAVALAFAMIRDGRMPSPEEARQARKDRRERRQQQPAQQRRRVQQEAARAERSKAWRAQYDATQREKNELPLYEFLSDIFDLADAELWKSNSFAALRPRLLIHVEAAVAGLEDARSSVIIYELTSSDSRRRRDGEEKLAVIEPRLARAREILKLLGDA